MTRSAGVSRRSGHSAMANGMITRAQRLFFLEQKDKEISAALHLLTRARRLHQEEARHLRYSLTLDDSKEYDALKRGHAVAKEAGATHPIYG